MSGIVCILHSPFSRLQRIMKDYEAVFSPKGILPGNLSIPPGWVDVLELAVEDAAAHPENHVQMSAIWVQGGTLRPNFIAGTDAGKDALVRRLKEAQEYCPCCGNLCHAGEKAWCFKE